MRVLLAEDNPDNRDMLTRRLRRRGFEVVEAEDGAAAVAAAKLHRPDLVLMDVSMPVMSGLDATRAIKADPSTAAIPVIALTAHAMASDRAACVAAGCDGFATKPVDFAALIDLIDDVSTRPLVAHGAAA